MVCPILSNVHGNNGEVHIESEHDVDRPRNAYGSKTKTFLSPIQTGSDEEVFHQGLILALSIER